MPKVLIAGGGLAAPAMVLSPTALRALREQSRARKVEGFMLKRLGSPYRVGRRRGGGRKWKINPYTVDCVLKRPIAWIRFEPC